MTNPNVKAKIIGALEYRGQLGIPSLAWAVRETPYVTEIAVNELMGEGIVQRHEDGRRYRLVDGEPVPPEAA